ncbi:aspartyl-phosphate phosphatase Spo0E family protein [Alkalihalobacillus sp. AL-G]|uniref:aspartyl-phosphate phosphatase Spo0E family protein n=1 Tax=Alkalihalobacillus sp. AL-G TaxID=2926399 RepID=UPI00272CF2F6|nr:aspartyl-phosphate phosphatase Spo0E family protein [Alkalihalobacillus sp. AL-G]WLD92587.1 aspartyl-phosphate phosphatase Spo0E family protein [Alkalihalobacillus sp. AL-G]
MVREYNRRLDAVRITIQNQLLESVDKLGLTHSRTVRLSEKLDKIIIKMMKLK